MNKPWRYWIWVRLRLDGLRQDRKLPSCQVFFGQQFPNPAQDAVQEKTVQRQLVQQMRSPTKESKLAETCLRCAISWEITYTCESLVNRFGQRFGFTTESLLGFVLTDEKPGRQRPRPTETQGDRSLADTVLRQFDPERSQLNTWTKRLVLSHTLLNQHLNEHGLYLESDWSLLNSLSASRLRSLLMQQSDYAAVELDQAVAVLQSYQIIYRGDRLRERAGNAPNRSRCQPPTPDQLTRMLAHLQDQADVAQSTRTGAAIDADWILAQLRNWAQMIRDVRRPPTVSLDSPEGRTVLEQQVESTDEDDPQQEFLQNYRQALQESLDKAIAQVIAQRVQTLARRDPRKAKHYLTGLTLFFCDGQSMGAIAPLVGLTQQYQVSRLLKVRELRADIRRQVQILLRSRIGELAQDYVDVSQFDDQLDELLDSALAPIFAEAEAETFAPQSPRRSLLNQRLCRYLIQRSNLQ